MEHFDFQAAMSFVLHSTTGKFTCHYGSCVFLGFTSSSQQAGTVQFQLHDNDLLFAFYDANTYLAGQYSM